ncbi:MAG: zinc-ribbon domain-containing protein [Saccharofermentanales bacterium]
MDKKLIIDSINSQLSKINISAQICNETDITLTCIFYDTKWRTGNKKIDYQAAAFADEAQMTLFFWESAKIADSGYSTATDSEITYQSGTSLYHQVKGIKTAADGTASEYLVDLGSIKKIFRETAKHSGWKFRAVMNKENALPPLKADFTVQQQKRQQAPQEMPRQAPQESPRQAPQEMPRQVPQQKPQIPGIKKFCKYCGSRIEPDFIFCSKCGSRLK